MSTVYQAANFAFGKDSWVEKGTDKLWKSQQKFLIGTIPAALQTVMSAVTVVAAAIFTAVACVGWAGAKVLGKTTIANHLSATMGLTARKVIRHTVFAVCSAINTATFTVAGKCVQHCLSQPPARGQQRTV